MGISESAKFLGDVGKIDELGVLNGFRKLSEMYIQQLVEEGKWFTICHKINDNQVDLMQIENADGCKLGRFIADTFEEGSYRTSIYKYMMMNFLCYLEVPTTSFKTDTGKYSQTFDKMLVTSNLNVVADWLGVTVDDLPDRYKTRLYGIDIDDGDDEIPYIKLTESKERVRKATCPKKNIDVSEKGTRVIPLFMLKAGVDSLYTKIKDGVVKVSFLKDNGQLRDIFTTVNATKIREIYGGGEYYESAVEMMYDGNFLGNKALSRGYIRVPEIGGSRYDTATRSINYARIINIDYEAEPDLSFIDIDLATVLEGFQDGVQAYGKQAEDIVNMLEAFDIDGGCWKDTPEKRARFTNKDMVSLISWSEERSLLYSTVFLREVCLFMLANPQWFGNFTGKPKESFGFGSGANNIGFE